MIIYEYQCPACGWITETFHKKILKYAPCSYITCSKCGIKAKRIPSNINTDLVNNVRYSNAMGVNPRQIPEAMKKYPGSVYNEKGQLRVDNRKVKLERMKQRGLTEFD